MKIGVMLVGVMLALSVAGCGTLGMVSLTRHYDHTHVQTDLAQPYAKVYFIRPPSEHVLGFSDNNLLVDVDGERLLSIAKGEYTLLYMKPREMTVTTRTTTQLRGRWELEEMTRSRVFSFEEGETYYLVLRPFDGEYRGAHFMPELMPLHRARPLAEYLIASGEAGRYPIPKPSADPTR